MVTENRERAVNVTRLREHMEERGLDAVIAASPENFYYSNRYPSFILYTARIAGLALAIIPRSESIEPVVIINELDVDNFLGTSPMKEVITYPMWVRSR